MGNANIPDAFPLSTVGAESHHEPNTTAKDPSNHDQRVLDEGTIHPSNRKPRTSKPLSFKLAFIGLAAAVFVFQMDATALGIALPVRPFTYQFIIFISMY